MSVAVFGELTADQQTIILMASGPDHEVARAAAHLQTLTPLIKATEPAGALQLPATWAAVVQLSATFGPAWRPGPALSGWISDQLAARTGNDTDLTVRPPAGLTPRPYQVAGARLIGMVGSGLLFDDQGPQPTSTPILTPSGWTFLGKLKPGDVVFDVKGRPTRVRAVKRFGEQPVYRVTLNDRTSTRATGGHRWLVLSANDRKRGGVGRKLTTKQLIAAGLHHQNGKHTAVRFYLPQQPVLLGWGSGQHLPLVPYAYGALLGDGSLGGEHLSITCPDDSVLRAVMCGAGALGTTSRWNVPGSRCQNLVFHRNGALRDTLDKLGALVGSVEKYVHARYLHADERTRRHVLAGLLDTDGSVVGNGTAVEFSSASERLAADVAWLGRSLGAVVTEADPQDAGYRDAAGEQVECLPTHRVHLRFPADGPNPFFVARKAERWAEMAAKAQRRNPPRTIQSIEPEGSAEVCCIELDSDVEHERVYLTDMAMIPTSNTGKTITTILGLRERHGGGHPVLPVVIVCPNAVVDSWVEHVHRWAPGWRAVAWRGTPKRRLRLAGTADVYVTSYGTARMDASTADVREVARGKAPLLTVDARMVIADEVHKVKSAATEQSRAVRRIAARAAGHGGGFVGLSGTPITHSPKDLWPALYCLSPGAWPSSERWVHRYCDTLPGEYADTVVGLRQSAEPEFRLTLQGQYRRVSKADVLADLPPKVYSVRHVDLPKAYREAYDALERDMLAELPDGGQLEAMTVLAQLTRLLQLASAAADVKTWTEIVEDPQTGLEMEKTHQEVTLRAPSWKVDELLEVMAERPGQQVAAYAPSRQLMMLAGQAATTKGYRVGYIVGGQSSKERTANVEAFQRGELDLICVTTGAGGVGITLTAAGTAVFLQRPWSLVEALQAEDRQHRIGSERCLDGSTRDCVEIVDILSTNTIETRVRTILKERAGQLSDLVGDPRIVAELLGGAGVRDLRRKKAAA